MAPPASKPLASLVVQRARFVELTAAIAGGLVACTPEPRAAAPVGGPVVVPVGDADGGAISIAEPEPRPLAPTTHMYDGPTDCELGWPTCEAAGWARRSCIAANERRLPAKARAELRACLEEGIRTRAVCKVEGSYACAARALALVPPAPGTEEPCERVRASCPNLPMAECQGVLSVRPVAYRERASFCLVGPASRCNPPGWCAFGDPDTTFVPRH